MKKSNLDINRRQFLKNGSVAVAALGDVGVGVNYLKYFSEKNNKILLHPLAPYMKMILFTLVLSVVFVYKYAQ